VFLLSSFHAEIPLDAVFSILLLAQHLPKDNYFQRQKVLKKYMSVNFDVEKDKLKLFD